MKELDTHNLDKLATNLKTLSESGHNQLEEKRQFAEKAKQLVENLKGLTKNSETENNKNQFFDDFDIGF